MEAKLNRVRNKAHEFLDGYERMNAIFEQKFGYHLYFIGGTLLGFIRERDFLINDKDMDVSYFSKYENVVDVRKEMIEIVNSLMDSGEELYFIRSSYTVVPNYFRWRVDTRDRIDIMPSWCQDGMMFRPTFVGYKGTKDIILPLKKEKFYDHDIYIPNDPERKLANVYGDDWKIPNPGFKKGTRKNIHTNLVIGKQLCYGKVQWKLIRRSTQWRQMTLLEKLFVHLIRARRFKLLAWIIPPKEKFNKTIFRRIRDSFTRSKRNHINK